MITFSGGDQLNNEINIHQYILFKCISNNLSRRKLFYKYFKGSGLMELLIFVIDWKALGQIKSIVDFAFCWTFQASDVRSDRSSDLISVIIFLMVSISDLILLNSSSVSDLWAMMDLTLLNSSPNSSSSFSKLRE